MSMLVPCCSVWCLVLFFFNDTATTEIYTLSLHDALPLLLGGLDRLRRFDLVRRLAEGLGYDPGLVHVFDPSNLDGRADRPESVLFDMSYAQNVLETRIVALDDAIAQIEPFKPRG